MPGNMILKTKLQYPGKNPKALRKVATKAARRGNLAMGIFWRKEIFHQHFEQAYQDEYLYRARNREYLQRKLRKFGHQDPLVYTGVARRTVMAAYEIKASAKHVSVKMPSPEAWKLSQDKPRMPNMRFEARTFSERDYAELAKEAMTAYKDVMNDPTQYDKEPTKTIITT